MREIVTNGFNRIKKMKTSIIILISTLVLSFGANAQTNDTMFVHTKQTVFKFAVKDVDSITFEFTEPEPPFLIVDETPITAPAEGGTFSIAVNSNGEWTAVAEDADWLNLAQNNDTVFVNVEENLSFEERSATLNITLGSLTKSVVVNQDAVEELFCLHLGTRDTNKAFPIVNGFLSGLSTGLDVEQQLKELTTYLKSHPCIIDARINSFSTFYFPIAYEMAHILISFDENDTTRRHILDVLIETPMKVVDYRIEVTNNLCEFEDPLTDLPWLMEIVDQSENNSHNNSWIRIFQYTYRDGIGFHVDVNGGGLSSFYNCAGKTICLLGHGAVGESTCPELNIDFENGKLIWEINRPNFIQLMP